MGSKYAVYEAFSQFQVDGTIRTVHTIFLDHAYLEQQDYMFLGTGGRPEARVLISLDQPGVEAVNPRTKILKGYLPEEDLLNFRAFCYAYFTVIHHDDDKAYVQGALETAVEEGLLDQEP
ncbi:hypothetical protein G6O67_004818 [Ophiocordyceps sinensis]|uniref:Uncharacterized protein n=2 Tax=Ophiocordyceps sinensis TaxID=72228 RepID=A0A8H4PQB5_9HYPO|nr:hypothetical protein OCS_06806 [Ophiocordyceps sinensis CO18]KAF4508441.1 hypothetical protein G6O67_004818 [Ophiocordyceps sinensis]